MMEAQEVMTKNVITVNPETPIYEAVDLLIDNRVSGLIVVDAENNLKGVISELDLMKLLIETPAEGKSTVNNFMSDKVISYESNDNIVEICECFMEKNIRRVPVTTEGKLVGVISRADIIKLIAKVRRGDS